MPKPYSCAGCSLYDHGKDFTSTEGLGSLGVMVVAEASGEGEARDGLPLRPWSPAGGVFERTLRRLGVDRQDLTVTNMVRCFISSKAMVLTHLGYRQIAKVRKGDLVLTHMGRFRKVTKLMRFIGDMDYVAVKFKDGKTVHRVTLDHRFWAGGDSWIFASSIKPGQKIKFLAEHCIVCGSAFLRHFSGYGKTPFCALRCHNIYAANKGSKKISESMRLSYKNGIRDASTVALKANEAFRKKVKTGWYFMDELSTDDRKRAVALSRINGALARQNAGLDSNGTWIGFGERAVGAILDEAGYKYIPQFAIEAFNYDFKIGEDLIVEVDGPASRNVVRRKRDVEKETLAISLGYRVVHIPYEKPESVLSILANDNHEYEFLDLEVESIERGVWNKGAWSLAVEEDESFVAQGAVHHNCRPRKNLLTNMSYESAAVAHCRPNLEDAYFDPARSHVKVILALGNLPFSYLTGHGSTGMTVSHLRGYVFKLDPNYSARMAEDADLHNVVVVPTYHPSHIRRGATELFGVFARDVMRAVRIARGEDFSFILDDPLMAVYRDELQYELHPSIEQAQDFFHECKQDPRLEIIYDLETSESASLDEDAREQFSDTRIRQIQFSTLHGQAIAMPWADDYLKIIQAILALPNPKVGHNVYGFDNRVLRAQGPEWVPAGQIHDTMLMWRRWQPELPANLQYCASFIEFPFAWKHLAGSNLAFYGCADVDATGRLFRMLRKSMIAQSMWQLYLEQVVKLHDLPAQVAKTGLSISAEVAEATLVEMQQAQEVILAELEKIYPESERTWEPEEGYKKTPTAVKDRQKLWASERLGVLLGDRTVEDGESEDGYVRRLTGMLERDFWAKVKNPATLMMDKQLVRRWCRPKQLSIHSRPQIIRYAKLKKHEIPTAKDDRTGELRESLTLADLDLMYGRTKDRFYGLVGKSRRIGEERKVLVDLKYEAMLLRGRIHSVFAISPTGEMASRSPGLPQPESLAIKCVVAAPGKLFVRWRWPQQRDRIMMQLAGSKLDYWQVDAKEVHPAALEGFLSGQSDRAVLEANRIVFGTSLKTVAEMRARFHKLWPEVSRWQEAIRQRAHRQNYLLNRFGEIRWFYEVYAPDGKGGMRLGDQAEAAARFTAETEAAGAMRWRLAGLQLEETMVLVAMARDWMMFEVAEDDVMTLVRRLYRRLAEVPPELAAAGAMLPMTVEVGGNWLEMQELRVAERRST